MKISERTIKAVERNLKDIQTSVNYLKKERRGLLEAIDEKTKRLVEFEEFLRECENDIECMHRWNLLQENPVVIVDSGTITT